MFEALGRAVVRGKWFVIAAWLALAAGMFFFAPSLAQVGTASDAAFLPTDSPSLIAQGVLDKEFPNLATAGQGLIVLYDKNGLTDADRQYARGLVEWLKGSEAPQQVGQVTSVFGQPELEQLLVSKDGTTMLVRMDFTSPPYSDATNEALALIRGHIHSTAPGSLQVDFTGQAAISKDLFASILDSVSQTTWVTIVLVILVLLIIYRAPIAAGIPLVTIGIAFLITRGVLGILVQEGIMRVSSMVEAFIVVLIFGAGTDYALFLISRYREEVAARPDHDRQSADVQTIARIGPVITASAATVIIGTLGMIVARFEMTRTQGPAMAMGIAIGLVASLTLTPALLSVFGKHLFWPFHEEIRDPGEVKKGAFWPRLAAFVTSKPGIVAAGITVLLLLPYIALANFTRSFDVLSELPRSVESRQGFDLLKQHFDQGEMLPVSVALVGDRDLQSPEGLASISRVQASLADVPGVDKVRSVVSPSAGDDPEMDKNLLARTQVITLSTQLKQDLDKLDSSSLTDPGSDPTSQFDQVAGYLNSLGAAFPEIKSSAAYTSALAALSDVKDGVSKSIQSLQVSTQLTDMAGQVGQLTSPSGSTGTQDQDSGQGIATIQSYLSDLSEAYPEVKSDPAYDKAVAAAEALTDGLATSKQQSQVSAQLALLAAQVEQLRQGLSAAQTPTPQPQQEQHPQASTRPSDLVMVVGGYLQELAQSYPEVKADPAYGDALTQVGRMQTLLTQLDQARAAGTAGPTPTPQQLQQMQQLSAELQTAAQQLGADLQTMSGKFAGRDAPFSSKILSMTPQAKQQRAALQQSASDLQTALTSLANRFQGRDARFIPKNVPPDAESEKRQADLKAGMGALTDSLDQLAVALPADAYFLPEEFLKGQPKLTNLVNTFLSSDRKTAQVQVLLAVDPYSEAAIKTVDRVESVANQQADSLGLTAYMAGPTAQVRDIHTMVEDDLPRVMTLVIGGVFLVFILLLGSLVAPFYLVATVLLSYGTTMGLITVLFQFLLGQGGINYVIPTIILVLLVALGADYNIFLISRVWEEAGKEGTVRDGVRRASAFTGGVITSAGIILAGTFAALTIAPIQTLSQVGTAVALGVLVDTFIVRAVLVPAIASLVGRLNWWPAKTPPGYGGAVQVVRDWLRRK